MKTLIIYDQQGKVVFTNTNPNVQEGEFTQLVVSVPDGKFLSGVNPETGEPIFTDIPPSDIETLRGDLENAIVELSMLISMGGM